VKILLDVQKQTGAVTLTDLSSLPDKIREICWEKV
jgi:hypothetical protein